MKHLSKTIIAAIALTAICLSSGARSRTLKTFTDKVASSCVSFDYSYSAKTTAGTMKGSGRIRAMGDSFVLDGDGVEVWCDGRTRWTVDRLAEEAVIEAVLTDAGSTASNPALLVTSAGSYFREVSFGAGELGGEKVDVSSLVPLPELEQSVGITSLKLGFRPGTSVLSKAWMELPDGTQLELTVSQMTFLKSPEAEGSFRFDEKTLGSSFIVTDLR